MRILLQILNIGMAELREVIVRADAAVHSVRSNADVRLRRGPEVLASSKGSFVLIRCPAVEIIEANCSALGAMLRQEDGQRGDGGHEDDVAQMMQSWHERVERDVATNKLLLSCGTYSQWQEV